MSDITIITNNVPRDVLRWYELTPKEQAEFDYLDTVDARIEASLMRYKGEVYDLNEFSLVEPLRFPDFRRWTHYQPDSYFSGIVIRIPDEDFETVIAGRYYQ